MSLAGIPPTMGFIAKAYVMVAGVGASLTVPLAALIIGSVIGLYYYLRVIVMMVLPVPEPAVAEPRLSPTVGAALAGLAILVVVLGAFPATLIPAIRASAPKVMASLIMDPSSRKYANRALSSPEKDGQNLIMQA